MQQEDFLSGKVQQAKAWFTSKTIFGIIMMAISVVMRYFFPELTIDADQAVIEGFSTAEAIAASLDSAWYVILNDGGKFLALFGIRVGEKKISGL